MAFNCIATQNESTNNNSNQMATEVTPVLEIDSDRQLLASKPATYAPLPSLLKSSLSDGIEHDIRDFLARPRMLSSFTWDTTNPQGSYPFVANLPSGALTSRVFASKLAGFAFFRATMVVRVMINTQRFQAGRLLLSWMPFTKQNPCKPTDTRYLTYFTQRPRVEFDVSTDTEVIMKIPYIHYSLAFDLGGGAFDAGSLSFVIYSVLTSGSCQVNAYYSFEDVELCHANEPGNFIAQSSLSGNIKSSKRSRRPRVDPGDLEAEAAGVRPISSMLSSLATTAAIGAQIPLISSVAGPVSWAAGLAAKAAHAFGYAKPLNLAPRMRTYEQSDTHRVNCDGAHMAVNLGLFEDNKVSHLPGFAGTDLDEMAISYVIGTYAYYRTLTWNTTQAEDTAIMANQACQARMLTLANRTTTVAGVTQAIYDFIPVAYVSTMFKLYRGSIKFKFKVVKTEFHSGRLRFSYRLYGEGAKSGDLADYKSANVHATIFDLRDSTEFEVVVPYAAALPYLECDGTYAYCNLTVETPLQAVGEVSSSVEILVEAAAHNDFEFAIPRTCNFTPFTISNQNGWVQSSLSSATEVLQNTGEEAPTAGNSSVIDDRHISAELCIGEKILSFRQLAKRMTRCMKLIQNLTQLPDGKTYVYPDFGFSPFSVVLPNDLPAAAPGTVTSTMWQPDYYTMIGCMYSMYRGSVRIAVRENGPLSQTTGTNQFVPSWGQVSATTQNYRQDSLLYLDYNTAPSFGVSFPVEMVNGCVYDTHYQDIQCPMYSKSHAAIVPIGPWGLNTATPSNPGPTTVNTPTYNVRISGGLPQTSGTASNVYRWIYRGIGEDFSFGYFTGTYPLVDINANVNVA